MRTREENIGLLYAAGHDLVQVMSGKMSSNFYDKIVERVPKEMIDASVEDLTDEDLEIGVLNAQLMIQAVKEGGMEKMSEVATQLLEDTDPDRLKRNMVSRAKMEPVYERLIHELCEEGCIII